MARIQFEDVLETPPDRSSELNRRAARSGRVVELDETTMGLAAIGATA